MLTPPLHNSSFNSHKTKSSIQRVLVKYPMAKLATLAALLAGLMLASFAAATLTTIEVDVGEDENESRRFGGGCREQIEMVDRLRSCEDFLREQARQGGFGFGSRRFGEGGGRFGSRRMRECCQDLRQMDDQCRCQGLREIVREQQMRPRGFGGEREDLERLAENLPQMCGVGPERCDIHRGGFGRWA